MKSTFVPFVMLLVVLSGGQLLADDTAKPDDEQQARFKKFEEMLSGVKLVGSFTVVGNKDDSLRKEAYVIEKVEKAEKGDYWVFHYKYGNNVLIPLPLEVKWIDDTPMITLTDLRILGQGPYGARVVFHDNMYAGTWSHGKVGGHFFGTIEKLEKEDSKKE